MIVNKKELAEIIGISERSLTEWQKEGLPVVSYADNRGQANEYDTVAVIRWLLQRELERLNKEKPRDRLDRVKAELAELERDEKLGQLAPAAMFERAWGDHVLAARTEFLTMPEQLAAELTATSGVEIDPDTIAAYINRALEKLSNYGAENNGDDSRNHAVADG